MSFDDLYRSRRTGDPGILKGIRAICRYCEISNQTFYGWVEHHDFPAAQLPDGRWCTSKILIDDWVLMLVRRQRERGRILTASQAGKLARQQAAEGELAERVEGQA